MQYNKNNLSSYDYEYIINMPNDELDYALYFNFSADFDGYEENILNCLTTLKNKFDENEYKNLINFITELENHFSKIKAFKASQELIFLKNFALDKEKEFNNENIEEFLKRIQNVFEYFKNIFSDLSLQFVPVLIEKSKNIDKKENKNNEEKKEEIKIDNNENDISNEIDSKTIDRFVKERKDEIEKIINQPNDTIDYELYADSQIEFLGYKESLEQHCEILINDLNNEQSYLEIKRVLHALKGFFRTIGSLKAGQEVHFLENIIKGYPDELENVKLYIVNDLIERLSNLYQFAESLSEGATQFIPEEDEIDNNELLESVEKKKEKINHNDKHNNIEQVKDNNIDNKILAKLDDINEVFHNLDILKLINANSSSELNVIKNIVEDFEEAIKRLNVQIKNLDSYTENNIQSTRKDAKNSDFDPLLMDRFNKVHEISRSFVEIYLDLDEIKKNISNKTKEISQNVNRSIDYTNKSSEKLTKMRLVNFSSLSKRFEETIKKVSKELGKKVEFILNGAETQIDINLINKIKTPIEHILRNSIGHGIEDIEQRRKLGKNDFGTIVIDVKQEANYLSIKISDDGYGLNIAKIKKKAIEKGMAKEEDNFDVKDAIHFILMPDFSTADHNVTNISGRGIGMEAVQNDIHKLGGTFEIFSEETKGMTVNISIPTSYTTNYGLVCNVGEEKIVILNSLVKEVISLSKEDFNKIRKENKFYYEDKYIDFRELKDILKVKSNINTNKIFYRILILEEGNEKIAIYIDEILENKELFIHNVAINLSYIPGVIGVITLVDGTPLFVFNPFLSKKFELEKRKILLNENDLLPTNIFNNGNVEIANVQNEILSPLIMVVDDSAVIRKVSEKFLDKHKFRHVSAKNGRDALEKLKNNKELPKVILLDIEMPEMNGFEFCEIVKQNEIFKNIPIIMITSRINKIHQEKAASLGVNNYLIKPFIEEELLKLLKKYSY